MPDEKSDPPVSPLGGAIILGVVAGASLVRLVVLSSDDAVTSEHVVWVAVCVVAAVFSAACAVVAALRPRAS